MNETRSLGAYRSGAGRVLLQSAPHAGAKSRAWPRACRGSSGTKRFARVSSINLKAVFSQRLHRLRRLEPKKQKHAPPPGGRAWPAFNHLKLLALLFSNVHLIEQRRLPVLCSDKSTEFAEPVDLQEGFERRWLWQSIVGQCPRQLQESRTARSFHFGDNHLRHDPTLPIFFRRDCADECLGKPIAVLGLKRLTWFL